MQIKKSTLKQIIQEEISKVLHEDDQEDLFQQKITDDIKTLASPKERKIVRKLVKRAQEIGGEAAIREIPHGGHSPLSSTAERVLSILLKDIEQRQRVRPARPATGADGFAF